MLSLCWQVPDGPRGCMEGHQIQVKAMAAGNSDGDGDWMGGEFLIVPVTISRVYGKLWGYIRYMGQKMRYP